MLFAVIKSLIFFGFRRPLLTLMYLFQLLTLKCHFPNTCLDLDGMAPNGHALAMAGQFITFRRNACPVNEQKVEIFILLFNRVFSAGTAAQ